MSRTLKAGELGVILVPFIAAETEDDDLNGMEDSLCFILENEDVFVEETLMARVLALGNIHGLDLSKEEDVDQLRDRALVAADLAAAIISGQIDKDKAEQWLAEARER